MAVRRTIVGIGSPRELEEALPAAYYLADDELATAAYPRWPWANRSCWKASPG